MGQGTNHTQVCTEHVCMMLKYFVCDIPPGNFAIDNQIHY